jgi:hypothetical protein
MKPTEKIKEAAKLIREFLEAGSEGAQVLSNKDLHDKRDVDSTIRVLKLLETEL